MPEPNEARRGVALPVTINDVAGHSYWEAPLRRSDTFEAARAAHPEFVSLNPDPLWVGTGISLVTGMDGQVSGIFIPDEPSEAELKPLGLNKATLDDLRAGKLNELILPWMFLTGL